MSDEGSTGEAAGTGVLRQRTRCKIEPSQHLIDRMSDQQRGYSPQEVEDAVYRGSKRYLERNKYIGRFGICEVVVYELECRLRVTTTQMPKKK